MARSLHVPRVYVDATLAVGERVTLSPAKRHHLGTVLRLAEGAPVTLFNGDGGEYTATVDSASRKAMALTIDAVTDPQRESPLEITLVQAIARGDRMDFAIAKAVELGATRIQPVFTARSQVKLAGSRLEKKQTHWQQVAESAAEQSGRLICPPVAVAQDLSALLAEPVDTATIRLMLAPGATHALGGCTRRARVTLLVGPESGLSASEIETAATQGWTPLALGPRVLRTETAGMAALAAIQACWGDLGAGPTAD